MTWKGSPERPEVDPGRGSQQKKIEKAIETLEEEIDDSTAFLWTGGKEAQVIADLLLYAVGDSEEQTPVPFIVIDTGNHYEEMYEFRQDYTSITGDKGVNTIGPPTGITDFRRYRFDEMIEKVIENNQDPRGYHGEWNETTELPDKDPVEGLVRNKKEWGVPESCGVLKTVPIKRIIEDGFDKLITGRRSTDPLTPGESGELDYVTERKEPKEHLRVNPLADWKEANVYAYIKHETVSLPSLYTEKGYRHTDSKCCTDDQTVGEYGEGGRDPQKKAAKDGLQEMGYV